MTLDPSALADMLAMVGDDPEFVGEIVDTYLADAPEQLGGMRTALAAGDLVTLGRLAHTLKGNSRNVGAVGLAEIARGIEEDARNGSVEGVEPSLDQADAAFAEVTVALERARETGWRT
jgi:HPt (histidine-containing phosphotransfer) domain-containing protein